MDYLGRPRDLTTYKTLAFVFLVPDSAFFLISTTDEMEEVPPKEVESVADYELASPGGPAEEVD